ncbi:LacI family DNA-binding transcriptional regulator [Dactylosporangium vinaceum]|uniref:LacI family DNA-binding transcriptional regulator n=1 Tax=Dactylosporangium vinaceum TaxID=53362 RepID=A0ABV5MN07_9ACTN|nr:LacI family DNA-binding transcriptional regulator [Dactylosporangium vinaceum]UAB92338.1 LacI family DNA-binding transcriptional regulator [Dactylosporangium vinaceum]
MVTRLSEVAKYAGYSEATVSRVLRDVPGIGADTRNAVLTALDVLGYQRPTRHRRELGSLVGMVLPDLHNPIFPAYAEAMAGALVRHQLIPVLCTRTADGVSEAHYIEMLLARKVAGIVFVGASYVDAGPEQVKALRARRLPIVLINEADENSGVPRVAVDDAEAADLAVAHLRELGHRRIGLIVGPRGHVPSERKLAEFLRLTGRPDLVAHTLFSIAGGQSATAALLAAGATGVVCASDTLALGAIRGARKQGLRVPEQLSVVGFDDSVYMPMMDPPLTTVRQPIAAIGVAAVNALVAQIERRPVSLDEELFEPELIVRGSTAAAPAD